MNQQNFVLAAYLVAALGIGGMLVWAWLAMRRAEGRAAALKKDRRA